MQRDHDGTPIFVDEDDAAAALENPDLSRDDRLAAELAQDAMLSGYTASELDDYDTISTGQADDLKHETVDGLRYWLSRCGVADGEPFEHTVTIERQDEGRWINVARYDGGELDEDEDEAATGPFALTISMGNAEMSEPEHVAAALRSVAQQIEDHGQIGQCRIRDANGNTVGRYGREAV